ncbi:MAG: phosphoribosylformylglycinamidine synthase subunit PurQ [Thermoanaerobaculia bacterium]|nr:phosphoribosylformylglycinamidine synthase subunit PurQ [Thermoanaerobaculia bacterium]
MSGATPGGGAGTGIPRVAVVVFPGSNCDEDAAIASRNVLGADVKMVRHDERALGDPDLVILPGGFSYGDYLRSGAMARFSPVMESVASFAGQGGAVLGICNGFQILCEAGLLPGAMLRNEGLRFVCRDVFLRVESKRTPFTLAINKGDVLRMPVAHGDGNWTAEKRVYEEMLARDQIVFRYVRADGSRGAGGNPNGSLDDVAGICNVKGNIVGLMPHPERASEELLGGTDGARLFKSFATTRMAMHGA